MILRHIQGWDGDEKIISENSTELDLKQVLIEAQWDVFDCIELALDKNNFISVSGNLTSDGIAIVLFKNGIEKISNTYPTSIKEIEETLISYFEGTKFYLNQWFQDQNETAKSTNNNQPEIRRLKSNNRHKIIELIASASIITSVIYIAYLGFSGEHKFIGHESEIIFAKVIETKMIASKGGFKQSIHFEFEYNSVLHTGRLVVRERQGLHSVGDIIKIKIAQDDPTIYVWKAKMKQN